MKTQDEINKAATEYGEFYGISNRSMVESAFDSGATFANGYTDEDMCGFAEWLQDNDLFLFKGGVYDIDGNQTGQTPSDLLKLYNERK